MKPMIETIIRRGMNGLGIFFLSYGSIRCSNFYKTLRGAALEKMSSGKDANVYIDLIGRMPETINFYLLLVFLGMLLIVCSEHVAKFIGRHGSPRNA